MTGQPPRRSPTTTRELGARAEALAAEHLAARGYRILARNFRMARGELDLVALAGTTLCFVEVRSRATTRFGLPEETIDGRKRARLVSAALAWLAARPHDGPCRFDVVAIHHDGPAPRITLIQDAFRLE